VVDATKGEVATDFLGFLDVSDVVTSLLKGARPARAAAARRRVRLFAC
jgi:hypothetical protein